MVDLGALAELDSQTRFDALLALQAQTNTNGLHVLLPSTALVPEAVFTFYDGWDREEDPPPEAWTAPRRMHPGKASARRTPTGRRGLTTGRNTLQDNPLPHPARTLNLESGVALIEG